jgi:MYXO-CTERM domain-containing protein
MLSDALTITVPGQNPGQIAVGLTSDTEGTALQGFSPENIGLTETGGLQIITTLTNSNGIQTTIRLQSDEAAGPAPTVPEASYFALAAAALVGFLSVRRRRRF